MSTDLEFFFDPVCPFCWVTSRWVTEVSRQRPLEVRWRPLSLAILNEGIGYEERKKAAPEYPDSHQRGLEMLRVVHAARETAGSERVGELYTALGELVWNSEAPEGDDFDAVMHEMARRRDLRPALERVGLPADLADAAAEVLQLAAHWCAGVGGTAGAVHRGLVPPQWEVGMLKRSLAPAVCVALGVREAREVLPVRGASALVTVHPDPEAAAHRVADLPVAAEGAALVAELREQAA